jgi:hypothetical protein
MRWLWASVVLCSMFWLNAVYIFTPPWPGSIWLVILAILLAGAGLRSVAVKDVHPVWLAGLIPIGVAVWTLPGSYALPAILVGAGLLLLAAARMSKHLAWVGLPVGLVGLMLSVQMACLPVLYMVSARVHDVRWLTPLFYGLARIFEPQASLSEGRLIIHYVNDNFQFLTRPESLGLIPGALIFAAGCVALATGKRFVRSILSLLVLVVGYSILRYVFLIFLTVRTNSAGVFWLPLPVALSYIPLALALFAVGRPKHLRGERGFKLARARGLVVYPAAALIAAAVFAIVGFFAYQDAGIRKQGRILIDELHSDWEWTTLKYDTQWYGRKSGYNYYCLADYLNHHYTVEATRDSLLPPLLSHYDVVMLKTPTSPYGESEINALVDFVRNGGGLWLIGDHTNVFGTSTYLNAVAARFGLRFRYDSTYDLRTMALSRYSRPPVFAHPTVAFLPMFLFATSCTMECPFISENMILGYGLKAMELDYARTSFFPRRTENSYGYGLFVQQGGVKYGKGRVAGFTDSTCFSNFFMFIPGKPELALATVEWLNRLNRFAWVNGALLAAGLLSLAGSILLLRRLARPEQAGVAGVVALWAVAGFLGLALAIVVYDGHVRRAYGLPQPHTDFTRVAFESEHSTFTLPTMGLTKYPAVSLHTFYVWTQRLGLVPSYESSLEDALARGNLVVVANPTVPLDEPELKSLDSYLEAGGRLLVIVDPLNQGDAEAELLADLGVEVERSEYDVLRGIEPAGGGAGGEAAPLDYRMGPGDIPIGEEALSGPGPAPEGMDAGITQAEEETSPEIPPLDIMDLEGNFLVRAARPTGLLGGTPLLRLSDGRVVLVEVTRGKGRAFVFADFSLFTVLNMGHTGEPIDERRRNISELEYSILRTSLAPDVSAN